MTKTVFLDVECYRNYFLICFKSNNKIRTYELHDSSNLDLNEIKLIMNKYLTIGFNSLNYDLPMISYALSGADNSDLKKLSDELVLSEKKSWEIVSDFKVKKYTKWNHIDLFEPSPAVMISLKMYGARMHTKKLQDLPIEPDELIKDHERDIIKQYCINDIQITEDLYKQIKDRIDLRQIMNDRQNQTDDVIDFRSKSDAQIAEAIFRKSLGINKKVVNKIDTDFVYKYKTPDYIKFYDDDLTRLKDKIENIDFKCDHYGRLILNDDIAKKINIGDSTYTIGIGGLHSNEKNRATIKGENEFLIDIDVVSYYPTIIINNRYFPPQLGERFLQYYKYFYDERIKAKKEGDKNKSESYKIILNGSFGKFGSIYSCLYSPSLLLHTTITGQLSLLMLIERIERMGKSRVISANTDGLTIKGDMLNCALLQWVLNEWQEETGYKLEGINYKAIYHESVNTYIGIKEDGSLKTKGIYADNGLSKHPITKVCIDAVINYLKDNILIENTIYNPNNKITDFISIRKVKGGGIYKDQYLGKVVRWYYSTNGDTIRYKNNNNTVALTQGCKPLMEIPNYEIADIDYNRYIEISNQMLQNLGVVK